MILYEINFCECWCGGEASKGKMFIRSHNSRVVSEETRRKRSESLKGQKRTEEQCKKISEGCKNKPPVSEETRQKMSISLKGKPAWNAGLKMSEEYCQKLKGTHPDQSGENNPMYGKHHTDEVRQQISESMKGKQKTPEHQAKIIASNTGKKRTEEHNKKMSGIIIECYRFYPEYKSKISNSVKKLYQDPAYLEKYRIACNLKPNKPESFLISLLAELYPNQWQYTGDFSYWINGKNPDFVNMEQKLIIEHFGDYWHRDDDPEQRKEIFAREGWDTLVLWEHELQNLDEIIYKIKKFVGDTYVY